MKKIVFGRISLYVGISIQRAERNFSILPSENYFSRSCGQVLEISEMETTHIKNALLKLLGLSNMRKLESEVVVSELSHNTCWNPETLGLYYELKSRVLAGVA